MEFYFLFSFVAEVVGIQDRGFCSDMQKLKAVLRRQK